MMRLTAMIILLVSAVHPIDADARRSGLVSYDQMTRDGSHIDAEVPFAAVHVPSGRALLQRGGRRGPGSVARAARRTSSLLHGHVAAAYPQEATETMRSPRAPQHQHPAHLHTNARGTLRARRRRLRIHSLCVHYLDHASHCNITRLFTHVIVRHSSIDSPPSCPRFFPWDKTRNTLPSPPCVRRSRTGTRPSGVPRSSANAAGDGLALLPEASTFPPSDAPPMDPMLSPRR